MPCKPDTTVIERWPIKIKGLDPSKYIKVLTANDSIKPKQGSVTIVLSSIDQKGWPTPAGMRDYNNSITITIYNDPSNCGHATISNMISLGGFGGSDKKNKELMSKLLYIFLKNFMSINGYSLLTFSAYVGRQYNYTPYLDNWFTKMIDTQSGKHIWEIRYYYLNLEPGEITYARTA